MYYNHNLRTNLQEWKNRLYRAPYAQLGNQLKYCIDNIEKSKILFGLLQEAILKYPYSEEKLNEIVDAQEYGLPDMAFENEIQHSSYCYLMLKHFIKICSSYNLHQFSVIGGRDFEDTKKSLVDEYIAPIIYYLH